MAVNGCKCQMLQNTENLNFYARDFYDLLAGDCFAVTIFSSNISVKKACVQVDQNPPKCLPGLVSVSSRAGLAVNRTTGVS